MPVFWTFPNWANSKTRGSAMQRSQIYLIKNLKRRFGNRNSEFIIVKFCSRPPEMGEAETSFLLSRKAFNIHPAQHLHLRESTNLRRHDYNYRLPDALLNAHSLFPRTIALSNSSPPAVPQSDMLPSFEDKNNENL